MTNSNTDTANDAKDSNNNNRSGENIFRIMDGIIVQLNITKKLFIIMILSIMIIPPIAFVLTFQLLGPPFHIGDGRAGPSDRFGPPPQILLVRIVPFVISIVWLAVGIWQWFVLSKWTKKYERYKQSQKRIDEKLGDNNNNDNNNNDGKGGKGEQP